MPTLKSDEKAVLAGARLFRGIRGEELRAALECLRARRRGFAKGETIFCIGERLPHAALLLAGSVHIQREDYWGNCSIVSEISAGELFGEAYAVPDGGPMEQDAVAARDCVVLLLELSRVLAAYPSNCRFCAPLLQNLYGLLAEKNRLLTQKLRHMARRTTREKLLSYLSEQARRAGSPSFSIPFNRQQLADYLAVDRSAMSSELGKLRDEGLLEFKKNRFHLA